MSKITNADPVANWQSLAHTQAPGRGTPLVSIEYIVYRVSEGESAEDRIWSIHDTQIGAVNAANKYHRETGLPCYGAVSAIDWLGMIRVEPQYAKGIALASVRHASQ